MPKNTLLLCGVSLMLISCGASYNSNLSGGGGSGSAGSGSGSAGGQCGVNSTGDGQGVYSGIASSGDTFWTIILPNDKLYGTYGTVHGNQLLLD
jgi:hypothetical protein